MNDFKERAGWVVLGLGLRGLAVLLMRIGKKDPMLGRALSEFDGAYRFENRDGKFFRYLVLEGGKVRLPRNFSGQANFTFTLHEPPGFYLNSRPERVLELVISNKITQQGDTYYLCQFGFIMSLVERYFKKKKTRE